MRIILPSRFSLGKVRYILVALLVVVSQFLSVSNSVFAYDVGFFSGNNILVLNPDDVGCSSTGGPVAKLSGRDNQEKIFKYLMARGLSASQAAGITGSLQEEGGFSPFRQEDSKTWPEGGYGIAKFTDGQRVAVTNALSNLGSEFTTYYVNDYGRAVTKSGGYIPTGITEDVNDNFLLIELNYLYQYASDFAPSINPERVSALKNDFSISIAPGTKLIDFIKTLATSSDVAEAWTYLYEYPSDVKVAATKRADNSVLVMAASISYASSPADCAISTGGLTFEQAKTLMEKYTNTKRDYFTNPDTFPASDSRRNVVLGNIDQCANFVLFFVNNFIAPISATGNGRDVVSTMLRNLPGFFTDGSIDQLQPLSVFSLQEPGSFGHTGIVLGVLDDKSVIIGESNVNPKWGTSSGLIEKQVYGSSSDSLGWAAAEHWKSIDDWAKAWALADHINPSFTTMSDPQSVSSKIQAFIGP